MRCRASYIARPLCKLQHFAIRAWHCNNNGPRDKIYQTRIVASKKKASPLAPPFRCRGCRPILCRHPAQTKDRPDRATRRRPIQRYTFPAYTARAFPRDYFSATSHTMFAVVGGTGPARPAVSHKAAVRQPLLPRKLRWGVGAAPAVTSWPMELLCERSALSPRPEPAIDGDLMKALIYRSPFDATLGLCGWRSLLTAAGLCARKTTVRGWVALEREGRRKV